MTDSKTELKVYALTPEQVNLFRKTKKFQEEKNAEIEALYARFEEERQTILTEINEDAGAVWDKIAPAYDIDPQSTFQSGQWYFDFKYIDMGHVFLCEREVTPEQALMNMPVEGTA